MSAIIQELKVRNFEGYKSAELPFSAGLNLIRGRNSTGKSTILDAMGFALFGEAPDINKKLLVSRLPDSQEVEVYIKFASPRTHETVEVKRKGKLDSKGAYRTEERTLHVNGKEINLESDEDLRGKITELLGASFRKFVNLVYVRQGKLATILEPQKDQMDSVIGITLLRELREQLDDAREELEKFEGKDTATEAQNLEQLVIPDLCSNVDQLRKDVEQLTEEAQSLDKLVKKGESPELTRLLGQIEKKENSESDIRDLRAKMRELLSILGTKYAGIRSPDQLEPEMKAWGKQVRNLEQKQTTLEEKVNSLLDSWYATRGKADSLESQIKEHEALLRKKISKCPTCGQDLKPKIMRSVLKADRTQLRKLRREEREAKETYETKKTKLDDLNTRVTHAELKVSALSETKETLKDYLDSIEGLEQKLKDLLSQISDSLAKLGLSLEPKDLQLKVKVAHQLPIQPEELDKKRKELEDKRNTLNEKTARKREYEERLKKSKDLVAKLKRRITRANLARSLTQRFEDGVEARRKDYLKRIEYKALEFYKTMTDQHVYSAISMDPEDYTVSVHPRGLTEQIPATRVGGGHQTILALAVRLALLETLGFRSLLILDEPTYGVDSDNLPQLASQLGEASRQLSQMILVTHHDICQEEASNIIEVTVGEDGISRAEVKL